MDSTPNPNPSHTVSIKAPSPHKLPVKRKNPDSISPSNHNTPVPNPNSSPIPDSTGDDDDFGAGGDQKPPPFKFHRIWTEPDEIRFLHGLLACSNEGLSFPKDLNVFYARFSGNMSQPYTKSQLSEKLRRLRKKYRVISSRLAKGLDKALLSPHDRDLYELSEQLWHPDNLSSSPFGAGNNGKGNKSSLVAVKVRFSPVLLQPAVATTPCKKIVQDTVSDCVDNDNDDGLSAGLDAATDVNLSEVKVEFDDNVAVEEESTPSPDPSSSGSGIGQVAAKAAIDVFDQSLKEIRASLVRQGLINSENFGSISKELKENSFEKRWRQQRVAELDLLARRLRLVFDHSLQRQ